MATGSISSLGVGSGLELQSIIDQLREVDKDQTITPLEVNVTDLEAQLEEFTVVKNKLLDMKSNAVTLSLSSTFLGRTVTSSDEDVLTATVSDGTTVQATNVTVNTIATKSSWLSAGASSQDTIVYVPTSQESTTGVTDPAAANYITQDDTIVITYGEAGSEQVITVNVTNGMSMDNVVDAINNDDDNGAGAPVSEFVTAETFTVGSDTFLRIKSTAGGTGESNRVAITTQLADVTFEPPTDVFQYEFGPAGDTTVVTLNVDADTTMSELVDLINDDTDNPGVTASIINDGDPSTPYRLLLKADSTGEDNRITITDQLPDSVFTEQQGAGAASLNAEIEVDSITYERQTNFINDVITGVTLSLLSAGSSSTITVSSNDDALKTLITDFVQAYNDAVQEINTNIAYDEEEEEFGILARTTVRDLPYDLQNLMTESNEADEDGNITSMFDLGLEFNQDGTITIDDTVLTSAISSYPDGIEAFFLGDSDEDIEGLADQVNDYLRTITGGTGQIEAEKSAAQTRIDDLELRIETETEQLGKKYDILTKQFIELDRYMNQMTALSSYLTTQFDSLSGLLGGGSSSS